MQILPVGRTVQYTPSRDVVTRSIKASSASRVRHPCGEPSTNQYRGAQFNALLRWARDAVFNGENNSSTLPHPTAEGDYLSLVSVAYRSQVARTFRS